jgi:protein-disulfide isomerase
MLGAGAAALSAESVPGASPDRPSGQTVIGVVGDQHVTADDIVARNRDAFARLRGARERQLQRLELDYAHAYHELVQSNLDAYLDERALELEAAARGQAPAVLKAVPAVAPVTDEEARAFYTSRKALSDQPYEQLADPIKEYLANERSAAATRRFYDELRAKHGAAGLLQPYRLAVAGTGPARGRVDAPVTIVEFADFQCPYCRQAEPVLQAVIARHPRDVRLVFRNLPLSDLHPDAMLAARAGACADLQGKFWQMHDAMFKDQTALGLAALMATADGVGLDARQFSSCLESDQVTAAGLSQDARAASALGVDSTPYFFIDGRPLRGVSTPEQFEKIIAEELRRDPKDRA